MPKPLPIFDAHLHADGLAEEDLDALAYFGVKGALLPAHDAVAATGKELLAHFQDLVGPQCDRVWRLGIRPYVALGVHPSRIPWHGLEPVLQAIPQLAVGGRVVAIGEIGLETGSEREEQVFARQLELAVELNLPVLVHTPEKDKLRITRRVLALVRESGIEHGRVLVDHAGAETLKPIRELGLKAGLTLNPSRMSVEEAAKLVSQFGSEGIVFSSDAGDGASDLLALPRAVARLETLGVSAQVIRRVAMDNALAFLGLTREALDAAPARARSLAR